MRINFSTVRNISGSLDCIVYWWFIFHRDKRCISIATARIENRHGVCECHRRVTRFLFFNGHGTKFKPGKICLGANVFILPLTIFIIPRDTILKSNRAAYMAWMGRRLPYSME